VTTATPDWTRLGDLLVTRRVQLDPRYKNRRTFVADTHTGSRDSWYRLITAIETGARSNYSRETIAAIEVAYRLEPGSLVRTRDGGDLEPARELVLANGRDAGNAPPPEQPHSEIEGDLLAAIRSEAIAQDKTIGDVLVERGLATPDELTLSDQKRGDQFVAEILRSDLSDDMKNTILMDYVGHRRHSYKKVGVKEEPERSKKKPRGM
jgi:hypothetical protein